MSPRYQELAREARSRIVEIAPEALPSALSAGAQLIDVREREEAQSGVIPSALVVPRGIAEPEIEERFPHSDTPIVLYCKSGNRSALLAENLQRMGYTRVKSLAGGIAAWLADRRPVEPPREAP